MLIVKPKKQRKKAKENNFLSFKSEHKEWRQKHDYKNLNDLDFQPNQLQPDQLQLPKWVKVSKERFNKN